MRRAYQRTVVHSLGITRGSQIEKIQLNQTIICRDPDQSNQPVLWEIKHKMVHQEGKISRISHQRKDHENNLKRLAPNQNMI